MPKGKIGGGCWYGVFGVLRGCWYCRTSRGCCLWVASDEGTRTRTGRWGGVVCWKAGNEKFRSPETLDAVVDDPETERRPTSTTCTESVLESETDRRGLGRDVAVGRRLLDALVGVSFDAPASKVYILICFFGGGRADFGLVGVRLVSATGVAFALRFASSGEEPSVSGLIGVVAPPVDVGGAMVCSGSERRGSSPSASARRAFLAGLVSSSRLLSSMIYNKKSQP
jgi:hypothetical protein